MSVLVPLLSSLLVISAFAIPREKITRHKNIPVEVYFGRLQDTPLSCSRRRPRWGGIVWDSFGTTINEDDFEANALAMAKHLKAFGWEYVVVDMEWYVTNPIKEGNSKTSKFSLDKYGRYTPAVNRFPSAQNDQGFKPIADYVQALRGVLRPCAYIGD